MDPSKKEEVKRPERPPELKSTSVHHVICALQPIYLEQPIILGSWPAQGNGSLLNPD
jgi:hypothetical protein